MKVLVCGGRDFSDSWAVDDVLDNLTTIASPMQSPISEVIHGGADGADMLADWWANRRGKPVRRFPADWAEHGKRAGPIRNQQMIDEARPDLVVAFPGGKGTADMVDRARKAGIRVVTVSP